MRLLLSLLCVFCWSDIGSRIFVLSDDPLDGLSIPLSVNSTNITAVHESFAALCAARGVPNADQLLNDTAAATMQCVQEYVAMDVLLKDMALHMANGSLDQLVADKCRRQLPDAVRTCSARAIDMLGPCWRRLSPGNNTTSDQEQADTVSERLRAMLMAGVDFFCYRDGERVAIFLHEQGRECMRAAGTREAGRRCLAGLDGGTDLWLEAVSVLTETGSEVERERHCDRLTEIRHCMTSAFEACDSSTPANVVDSVLAVMLKPLDCRESVVSAANPLAATTNPLATFMTALLLLISLLKP